MLFQNENISIWVSYSGIKDSIDQLILISPGYM